MIKTLLQSIWKWLILALVIACAGFLFIHFLWPRPPIIVPLPNGGSVNLSDNKAYNNSVQQIDKKITEQGKQINILESTVRKYQSHLIDQDIPVALKETNIRKSIDRMKEAWKR